MSASRTPSGALGGAPRVLRPSIEHGPEFAAHLAQLLDRSLPPDLSCTVIADIQGGAVEAVRLGGRPSDWREFGDWARSWRLWLQRRTPDCWWGSLSLRIATGRLSHVVIRRTLQVWRG